MHEPGLEYLGAIPVEIIGLPELLRKNTEYDAISIRNKAFGRVTRVRKRPYNISGHSSSFLMNPFTCLPLELLLMVWEYLPSKDFANLRLASRACVDPPSKIFRRLIQEDMPGFWELEDLPLRIAWFDIYMKLKFCWVEMKVFKNRKRVWGNVSKVVNLLESFRHIRGHIKP